MTFLGRTNHLRSGTASWRRELPPMTLKKVG